MTGRRTELDKGRGCERQLYSHSFLPFSLGERDGRRAAPPDVAEARPAIHTVVHERHPARRHRHRPLLHAHLPQLQNLHRHKVNPK